MEAIAESKFDKFANDFYRFCSIRYDTKLLHQGGLADHVSQTNRKTFRNS
jgi:hypothetical protein